MARKSKLLDSIRSGDAEEAKRLICSGRSNVRINEDQPLRLAAAAGMSETAVLLLHYGADVAARHHEAMVASIENGHDETAKEILAYAYKTKLKQAPPDGVVFAAARYGRRGLLRELIAAGANVTGGDSLALAAAAGYADAATVEFLIDAGAKINGGDGMALVEAVHFGREGMCRILLEAGADPHAGDDAPIREAREQGRDHLLRLLERPKSAPAGQIDMAKVEADLQGLRRGPALTF